MARTSKVAAAPAVRNPPAWLRDAYPLIVLGSALVYTNPWFTIIDNEAQDLSREARPVSVILSMMRSGQQWHLPLYDLLLHVWLRVTGGAFDWLRVPSIFFFLAGFWLLSRAAHRIGGPASATALVWLGVLWPYGFLFGRLAAWYSFVFLVISATTWAYLRFCDLPGPKTWRLVVLLCLVLVYTNYFGWALVVMLGVDDWLRHRVQPGAGRRLAGSAALLIVAYAPAWPAFLRVMEQTRFGHSWKVLALTLGYNIYVLLVSESMAPWYWRFGVPATLGVAACLLLVFFRVRTEARRFLLYGALLTVVMAAIGILDTKRLILAAPWFLLPLAVAVGAAGRPILRWALAVSLLIVGGIGWYGIYSHNYFAAPRFLEPWSQVAADAAGGLKTDSAIIGNNPSFFFYLTYALKVPASESGWRFVGMLPSDTHLENVWSAEDWIAAGRPILPRMLWVRGMPGPDEGTPMAAAADWLDRRCGERTIRYFMPDRGYDIKHRYFPELGEVQWRIEIHQYDCSQAVTPPESAAPAAGTP